MTWFIFMGGMVLGVVVAYLSGMPTLQYPAPPDAPTITYPDDAPPTRGELRSLRAREATERNLADLQRLKRKYGAKA